ncbi:MAG: hypothetical protein JNK04_04140 [Myxococcales bacterium]|nr:hypothetical protein [Myxococcales bacterium]
MNVDSDSLKKEVEAGMTRLQGLRDEVRVRLHLAGMELKDEWAKLEPYLLDLEKKAIDATASTRDAITHGLERLETLRKKLD